MHRTARGAEAATAAAVGAVLGLVAGLAVGSGANAHDASSTAAGGIVNQDDYMSPGAGDDASNGVRIFLSSPRHIDSGSRGECWDPGFQENVNGRRWNWFAANKQSYLNLHRRGYTVRVSRNSKDNGYAQNSQNSQNWGADIHIITHTNAFRDPCPETSDYTLFWWEDDADDRDDRALANELRKWVGPEIPGPVVIDEKQNQLELDTNARWGDAYVELQFHTNPARQTWLFNNTDTSAPIYGNAIDTYLGNP